MSLWPVLSGWLEKPSALYCWKSDRRWVGVELGDITWWRYWQSAKAEKLWDHLKQKSPTLVLVAHCPVCYSCACASTHLTEITEQLGLSSSLVEAHQRVIYFSQAVCSEWYPPKSENKNFTCFRSSCSLCILVQKHPANKDVTVNKIHRPRHQWVKYRCV